MLEPMKASKVDLSKLEFPCMGSIKFDGIRALVRDGVVLSSTLKPIRNKFIQDFFGSHELEGFDGELIVGDPSAPDVMQVTNSGVMSADGTPDVSLFAFDLWNMPGRGFIERLEALRQRVQSLESGVQSLRVTASRIKLVQQYMMGSLSDVESLEAKVLAEGYEGLMLRSIDGPYKHGRSTTREGHLLKLKRFTDGEAEVIAEHPLLLSSLEGPWYKWAVEQGLCPDVGDTIPVLGTCDVRDTKTGVEFNVGGGWTMAERIANWGKANGRIMTYRSFPISVKDKPRFPCFQEWHASPSFHVWRDPDDISN